jgi:hypothetical protein
MVQAVAAGAAGFLLARMTHLHSKAQVPVVGYLGMGIVLIVLVWSRACRSCSPSWWYSVRPTSCTRSECARSSSVFAIGGALLDVLAAESVLSRGATVGGSLIAATLLASDVAGTGTLLSAGGFLVVVAALIARAGIVARQTSAIPIEGPRDE